MRKETDTAEDIVIAIKHTVYGVAWLALNQSVRADILLSSVSCPEAHSSASPDRLSDKIQTSAVLGWQRHPKTHSCSRTL